MQTEFLEADDVVTTAIEKQNCNNNENNKQLTMSMKITMVLHLFQKK